MFKKLFTFAVLPLLAISSFLSASVDYDINDIDTLQTHSSEAIALNNQGQILGWYNIDGSKDEKYFFVRDRNGDFHEIPGKTPDASLTINWQYLTDGGKAYGTFAVNQATTALCMWDEANGFDKLGVMPGKEVVAVNNVGQVLIKSVQESENGKIVTRPVIWHNNKITKLKGLEGDLGVESEESYGFDMNNKGEVVGQSLISLVYKNNVYKKIHATKWVNGKPEDLHYSVQKAEKTSATATNDCGDISINKGIFKLNNLGDYISGDKRIKDRDDNRILHVFNVSDEINKDNDSIWMRAVKFIAINNNREIIAEGETIYGEKHVMFLTPKNP